MKYYSKEFRLFLTGLLTGYRKMLEQSLASSTDSNYHLLANDTKKQIDEAIRIAKPTAFNSTDKSFQKLQEETEEYLRQMETEYREKEAELAKSYQDREKKMRESIDGQVKARVEQGQKEQEDKIRSELSKQFEQEKKTMISVELLPKVLQEFLVANNYVSTAVPPVVPAATFPTVASASPVVPAANVATAAVAAEQQTEEAQADEDDGFDNNTNPNDNIV